MIRTEEIDKIVIRQSDITIHMGKDNQTMGCSDFEHKLALIEFILANNLQDKVEFNTNE